MPRLTALTALLAFVAPLALAGPAGAAQGAPPVTGLGEPVSYSTDDGVTIHGRLFLPAKGKEVHGGIVFIHEPMRSARDWTYMAEKMAKHGFFGLTFDLRGHGLSVMQGDEELDRELFGPEEFLMMVRDVSASVGRLRDQDGVEADRVHLAGADLGGSLAVLTAIDDPDVRSVAMLSPGLGYDGVNMVKKVAAYGKRNLMLVYSTEDSYSRKSAEFFQREARGGVHVETYYGVGHGTKMLSREPKLENLMMAWFLGTVLTDEGRTLAETGKPLTQDKAVSSELDEDAARERLAKQRKEAEEASAEAVGEEEERKRWQDEDD